MSVSECVFWIVVSECVILLLFRLLAYLCDYILRLYLYDGYFRSICDHLYSTALYDSDNLCCRLEKRTAMEWGYVGFEDEEADRPEFKGRVHIIIIITISLSSS